LRIADDCVWGENGLWAKRIGGEKRGKHPFFAIRFEKKKEKARFPGGGKIWPCRALGGTRVDLRPTNSPVIHEKKGKKRKTQIIKKKKRRKKKEGFHNYSLPPTCGPSPRKKKKKREKSVNAKIGGREKRKWGKERVRFLKLKKKKKKKEGRKKLSVLSPLGGGEKKRVVHRSYHKKKGVGKEFPNHP